MLLLLPLLLLLCKWCTFVAAHFCTREAENGDYCSVFPTAVNPEKKKTTKKKHFAPASANISKRLP